MNVKGYLGALTSLVSSFAITQCSDEMVDLHRAHLVAISLATGPPAILQRPATEIRCPSRHISHALFVSFAFGPSMSGSGKRPLQILPGPFGDPGNIILSATKLKLVRSYQRQPNRIKFFIQSLGPFCVRNSPWKLDLPVHNACHEK